MMLMIVGRQISVECVLKQGFLVRTIVHWNWQAHPQAVRELLCLPGPCVHPFVSPMQGMLFGLSELFLCYCIMGTVICIVAVFTIVEPLADSDVTISGVELAVFRSVAFLSTLVALSSGIVEDRQVIREAPAVSTVPASTSPSSIGLHLSRLS